jgi:hypothetical protein
MDTSRFTNPISYPLNDADGRHIRIMIETIDYSDEGIESRTLRPNDSIAAIIDSSFPEIRLPRRFCRAFEEAFDLQYNMTMNWYTINDTHHANLMKRNARVTFTLSETSLTGATTSITFPYSAFALNVTYPYTDTPARRFSLSETDEYSQAFLGRTFLQEACVQRVEC